MAKELMKRTTKRGKKAVHAIGKQLPTPQGRSNELKVTVDYRAPDLEAEVRKEFARLQLDPRVRAAEVAFAFTPGEGLGVQQMVEELRRVTKDVKDGDLGTAEAMLIGQAHALQAIFANLAYRAQLNFGEHLDAGERYLRLALKAQSQCNAAIQTLVEVKYPRQIQFIRQQNVAENQQINNGQAQAVEGSRGRGENETQQPKLLEANDGERLDEGTKGEAGKAYPRLATVA